MKKDEIYMTYLLLSPTKGMSGLVDNNESLLDISNNTIIYITSFFCT